MNRRAALRALAAATATTSFLTWEAEDLLAGLREHAHTPRRPARRPQPAYRFRTLDPHQRATVAELAEMILPATDTPGAKAAKVDEFVDLILTEWSRDEERAEFLAGLAELDVRAVRAFGKTFVSGTSEERAALLTALDAELTATRTRRRAWRRESGEPQPPDHRRLFFHQMRALTVSGYYSSEVGYTLERRQSIVPGIYRPCMPAEAG